MKKVLYVLNDGMRKFSYERTAGLYRAIQRAEEDINLFIVRGDGYTGFEPAHNRGEYNIFRLPDYRDFDGIFLDINYTSAYETTDFTGQGLRCAIDAAAASGKPVVSLANYIEGFHYVGIDNHRAMTSMIAHLHGVMGLTDFWFAMGPKHNYENRIRTQALTDYCATHDIPCGPERFYAESYIMECGAHAFHHFMELHGGRLPQVVVCANDQIAAGMCQAAAAAGYNVPGDFMVTGFDNLDMSAYLSPSITTVDQLCWNMGDACLDTMLRIWRGEDVPKVVYTPTRLMLRESTGHPDPGQGDFKQHVTDLISCQSSTTEFSYKLSTLQYQLPGCTSIREMCLALTQCLSNVNCKGLYLVLDRSLFDAGKLIDFNASGEHLDPAAGLLSEGYSDSMELVFSWSAGKKARFNRHRVDRTLSTTAPRGVRENYLYVPLHFMEYTVGYLSIWNCEEMMHIKCVSALVNTLTMALRSYFAQRDLGYINRMLSGISMKDDLTGLYNRLGFHNLGHALFSKVSEEGGRLGILFIDMDKLKHINDTYGHATGDQAIRCVSNAIRNSLPRDAVPVRFGGDEFLALVPADEPEVMACLIEAIEHAIPAEAERLGVVDVPGISAGFVLTEPGSDQTLDEYVEAADNLMYEQKRKKQSTR